MQDSHFLLHTILSRNLSTPQVDAGNWVELEGDMLHFAYGVRPSVWNGISSLAQYLEKLHTR